MTNLTSPFFNVFNISDDVALALDGAEDIVSVELNGVVYVYVAGEADDGVQVLAMDADGSLSVVGQFMDDALLNLDRVSGLEVVKRGGKTFVIAAGQADDGLSVFEIDPTTGLSLSATNLNDTDDPLLELDDASVLTSVKINGRVFVYAGGFADDGISAFELQTSGTLSNFQNIDKSDDPELRLNAISAMETRMIGGDWFLFAAGLNSDGVSAFSIDPVTGQLTHVDSIEDGGDQELNGPKGLALATVDGVTYLYVAGSGDNGIGVYEVSASGEMTNTANVSGDATLLNNVTDLQVIEVEGAQILIASAPADDELLYFSIRNDGDLELVDRIGDDTDMMLDGVGRMEVVTIGESVFVLAAGQLDDGVSVFKIGGDKDLLMGTDADDVLVGGDDVDELTGGKGADLLFGGGDDDLLTGSAGSDTLYGGEGSDELIGRGADDVLYGGAGNDLLSGTGGVDILIGGEGADILIGGWGIDTADYSSSTGLVRVDLFNGTANKGDATGDILILVENLIGTSKKDQLTGDGLNNRLEGGGGADKLKGFGGDDVLIGDFGGDEIFGGSGDDHLQGGEGDDTLQGGKNQDVLEGGGGDDTLGGDQGEDVMTGGDGADRYVFTNGGGQDSITDFADGVDLLDLSGHSDVSGFGDLGVFQAGANVLVVISGADSVLLEGFSLGMIGADDFVF